jgi:hypothetical protein
MILLFQFSVHTLKRWQKEFKCIMLCSRYVWWKHTYNRIWEWYQRESDLGRGNEDERGKNDLIVPKCLDYVLYPPNNLLFELLLYCYSLTNHTFGYGIEIQGHEAVRVAIKGRQWIFGTKSTCTESLWAQVTINLCRGGSGLMFQCPEKLPVQGEVQLELFLAN